ARYPGSAGGKRRLAARHRIERDHDGPRDQGAHAQDEPGRRSQRDERHPAPAPATRPVTVTNSACQPNAAATWPRLAPTRPSSRSARRRSTVATASVFTRATAASAATSPRIRLLAKPSCAAARSAAAFATLRLATCQPGWPAASAARPPAVPPLTRTCANPGAAPVCPSTAEAGISTSPDASDLVYSALTEARYGVPSGR